MSVDSGLLRLEMQHGSRGVLIAAKHNKRKLASHKGANAELSPLNYSLRGSESPEQVAGLAKQLMADAGIYKLKKVSTIAAIEFVSSLPVGSTIDPMSYFPGFVAFIEGRFGAHNILSADVHLDESAPHCHILFLPLVGTKLDASGIIGGRDEVNALQEAFYTEFANGHGLHRPPAKLSGNARKNAAKLVLDRLAEDADASMVSGVWAAICETIGRYPEPFMEALGIPRPASGRPAKTFEHYATSTGAGPKSAAGEASRDRHLSRQTSTHIGDEGAYEVHPLSCVGHGKCVGSFASSADHPQRAAADPPADNRDAPRGHPPHSAEQNDPPAALEYTRTRDADLDPADFDLERGEYIARQVQTQSGKAAAGNWVGAGYLLDPMRQHSGLPDEILPYVSDGPVGTRLTQRPAE